MSHRTIAVTLMVLVCLVAAAAAGSKHDPATAKEGSRKASAKAFNPLGKMQVQPSTKESGPEMLAISKAASAAVRAVDSATGTLNGIIDRMRSIQSMTHSAAQDTIDGVVSRAQAKAAERGGEPGCVIELMGRAGALAMQLALDETDCPGNKITSLEDMAQTLVNSGETALTMVPKAEIALDMCARQGVPLALTCSAKVVTELTSRAGSVGLRATEVVTEATTLAGTIAPSLATCAATKVAASAAKAAQLVGKFGVCSGHAVVQLVG